DKAGKALDNLDYHINGSLNALGETTGSQKSYVATRLYVSSMEESSALTGIKDAPELSPDIKDDVARATADTGSLNQAASQVLTEAGVNLTSIAVPTVL